MTPWERKLWYCFLSKYPVRFQRQKAIGNYIVDFYICEAQIVIEVDEDGYGTSPYGSDEIQDLLEQGYIVYVWCENMVYPLLCIEDSIAQFMNTEKSGRTMLTNIINIDINKQAQQITYANLYAPYVFQAGQYILKYSSNGVASWVDFDAAVVESVTNNFTNVSQEGA